MRFTYHRGFTLEVWVSGPRDKPLPEYNTQIVRTISTRDLNGPDTEPEIRCWIPSTEGSKFRIHFRVRLPGVEYEDELGGEAENESEDEDNIKYTYANDNSDNDDTDERENEDGPDTSMLQDIRCSLWLDGREMSWSFLEVKDLRKISAVPISGIMSGEIIEPKAGVFEEQPYTFGRLIRTNDTQAVRPDDAENLPFLNNIHVKLSWGRVKLDDCPEPTKWESRGPILEQDIQSNNDSLAKLGVPVPCNYDGRSFRFKPSRRDPVWFVFQHAPPEWLSAQGIIPSPSPPGPNGERALHNTSESRHPESTPRLEESSETFRGNVNDHTNGTIPTRTTSVRPPSNEPSRTRPGPAPRNHPERTEPSYRTLKRARSPEVIDVDALDDREIIDVDALSDSELQLEKKWNPKLETVDSKPPTSTHICPNCYTESTPRGPRPRPNKRVKAEKDMKPKLETKDTDIMAEGAGTVPLKQETELDVELKQEDVS